MNRIEAREKLIAAFPGRAVCIRVSDWHHPNNMVNPRDDIEFTVSVLPGPDGSKCAQATSATLEKAVKLALDWLPMMPDATQVAQEADDCFAEPQVFEQGATR